MQSSKVRLFFGDPDSDARFIQMIQDPVQRQERLKVLEQQRTVAKWSLFVFVGLLFVMAVAALTSSNMSSFYFPLAMDMALVAGAAAQHSAADAKSKMIKLYVLLMQNSNRAT